MDYLLQIPNGTQVVINADRRVGVVKVAKKVMGVDLYLVRFPDGHEEIFGRADLSLRKHVQREIISGEVDVAEMEDLLTNHLIYQAVVGSRSFGLDTDTSDVDRRGIFLAPADLQWSLQGAPTFLERTRRHLLGIAALPGPRAEGESERLGMPIQPGGREGHARW